MIALLTSLAASQGAAQDEPTDAERTAAARALFQQGMRAVDEADWETAADRLRRSLELRASPVVRYNLALALAQLGRLVEASEHLRGVQRETPEGSDAHRLAGERLEAILPQLGRLRIDVTGHRAGVQVRLDGAVVPDALLGVPQPADPGAHRITLHRGDDELAASDATVESGALATVTLEAPPPPAPSPEEVARAGMSDATSPSGPVDTSGGIEREWWFWTLIGAVVAGAVVAIAVVATTSASPPPYVVGDSGTVHPTLLELP